MQNGSTTAYGYYIPANGDTGDVFFAKIAANFQSLSAHTHNGTDSPYLASTSQVILAANWAAAPIGGGLYMQTVTIPSGVNTNLSYDTCQIWFKLSSGQFVYPSIERVSASQYNIYTSDNSLQYTAYYR